MVGGTVMGSGGRWLMPVTCFKACVDGASCYSWLRLRPPVCDAFVERGACCSSGVP